MRVQLHCIARIHLYI
nr:hypothetical chloroplast RF15 [Aster souliei]YP_010758462.1 hypothetical chloroplast RF15 [Aster souliei]YP_010835217.1 hypothetical chloroplast RF15 [Aster farreri]YP_010835230.1 hypothetical chloroplast RF15 [Aster farreri]WEW63897.1 hypothetical chloroplast RF15 [Aster souliei]WEW63910.1 hypothetical chloroplast RF15 [Aster souliei]WFQ82892.1 hypothetical chloroplast RF15 [Aster farreri]WFQ82905.1 hypothetical chloroplast RF15 [Aster farreri]